MLDVIVEIGENVSWTFIFHLLDYEVYIYFWLNLLLLFNVSASYYVSLSLWFIPLFRFGRPGSNS